MNITNTPILARCAACRGPQNSAEESSLFCNDCSAAMVAIVSQQDEQPQQEQEACCVACHQPLQHDSHRLCPGCLDATKACVDEDDDSEQDFSTPATSHNNENPSPDGDSSHEPVSVEAMAITTPTRQSPVRDSDDTAKYTPPDVTAITVKSPGRLIQEKFLAACANGQVVELLLSSPEDSSPAGGGCEILDVRSLTSNNRTRQVSASSSVGVPACATSAHQEEPADQNEAAADDDDDDDDCIVVGVKSSTDQVQERARQAAAAGQVIDLAVASQNETIDLTITNDDDEKDPVIADSPPSSSRKRPALDTTCVMSNPRVGESSPQLLLRTEKQLSFLHHRCIDCGCSLDKACGMRCASCHLTV